jgi:hypothetical protein
VSHRLQQIEALTWWHITSSWRQALSMNEEMKEKRKEEQEEKKYAWRKCTKLRLVYCEF